jgi:phosphatidylserine decarboxylase
MSIIAGKIASSHISKYANKFLVKLFKIDMSESSQPIESFKSFQELFTRHIKKEFRPINSDDNIIVSPCDGKIIQCGRIKDGAILQVKNKHYSVNDLILDPLLALKFNEGFFCTIYLAPNNYHRFHMPVDGRIIQTSHIPGTLWQVNSWGVNNIANLLCVNERIISFIEENKEKKLIAHVAVGACLVGKIKLSYGLWESNLWGVLDTRSLVDENIFLNKGQELGLFEYGSTIVLLFENNFIKNLSVSLGDNVKFGEALGRF